LFEPEEIGLGRFIPVRRNALPAKMFRTIPVTALKNLERRASLCLSKTIVKRREWRLNHGRHDYDPDDSISDHLQEELEGLEVIQVQSENESTSGLYRLQDGGDVSPQIRGARHNSSGVKHVDDCWLDKIRDALSSGGLPMKNEPRELASIINEISSMRLQIHNLERRLAAIEHLRGGAVILDFKRPAKKEPSPSG
jgi:hypothetical protein